MKILIAVSSFLIVPSFASLAGLGSLSSETEGIRCRCNGHWRKPNMLVCYHDDGSFFEERICEAPEEDAEFGQECFLEVDKSIAYGDWVGACRLPGDDSTLVCNNRDNSTGVKCKCNDAGANGYVDCFKEDGCLYSRHFCDHQQVCSSHDLNFPYAERFEVCQLPSEEEVKKCRDNDDHLNETEVKCKCRGVGNTFDCFGSDGCLLERGSCAPDEECSSFVGYSSTSELCNKGYSPIAQENVSEPITLKDADAYYYCIRPGAVSCNVTDIHANYASEKLSFGVFGISFQGEVGPYYSKILKAGLTVGEEFQSMFNENSFGVLLDINEERRIYSDNYFHNFQEVFTARYHDYKTYFTFKDYEAEDSSTVVELECRGFRPISFFQGLPYDDTKESCERDAYEALSFRAGEWPPATWHHLFELKKFYILLLISGVMSMTGSGLMIFAMVNKWARHRVSGTRERLLLGLSCVDFLCSFALALGPVMSPVGAMQSQDGLPLLWFKGNTTTCEMQGFFLQMGFGVPLYNSVLCIYYLMVLVFLQDPNGISPWAEVMLHILPISFSIVTASMGAANDIFNSDGRLCWIEPSPYNCYWNDFIPCERGKQEEVGNYMMAFAVAPVCFAFICIFFSMSWITISVTVREGLCKCKKTRPSKGEQSNGDLAFSSNGGRGARNRTLGTYIQAVLYVFAFLITYTFLALHYLAQFTPHANPAWVEHCVFFFWPLQGFWNFLIFIRPTFMRVRRREPSIWWWRALFNAVKLESSAPRTPTNSSSSKRSAAFSQALKAKQSSSNRASSFISKDNLSTRKAEAVP